MEAAFALGRSDFGWATDRRREYNRRHLLLPPGHE